MAWRGGVDVMLALMKALEFLGPRSRQRIYKPMIKALIRQHWCEPGVMLGRDEAYDAAYRELGLEDEDRS